MLVSFTQTYGSGRDELLDIYFRDKRLIELKNHFDQNIYSFHNCQRSTIDKFKRMSEGVIKNSVILEFNNSEYFGREQWFDDGYTKVIKEVKNYLRSIGCTHFFFSQDDTFSAFENKDIDWQEFVDYIKGHDKELMINLYHRRPDIDYEGVSIERERRESFDIYKTTTLHFANTIRGLWPMDDSPFICTMDILEDIYDDEYFNCPLICIAENHLRDKYETKEINRFITNKKIFQNYNIYGPNIYMESIFRKILERNGLL